MKLVGAVILLLAAAALLATAALSRSWYERDLEGETTRFRLLGLEVCREDRCLQGKYDPEVVEQNARTEFTQFVWAGRIAYGTLLASAGLCALTIALMFLGRDRFIDKHLAGWTAFLGAWIALAFCQWKPSGLYGLSVRYPLYLAFAGTVLAGLAEWLASDVALERRIQRDAKKT